MQIVVIGSGSSIPEELEKLAEEVGKEIAKSKAVLVCGGKGGVMEAACKGAKSEGGLTVGIFPGDGSESNEYIDIKVPTNLGYARNSIVANSGDVVIAINGALGTLTEIAYAVASGKPIIILEGSGGISDIIEELEKIPEVKKEIERFNTKIFKAKTAKEAIELAKQVK